MTDHAIVALTLLLAHPLGAQRADSVLADRTIGPRDSIVLPLRKNTRYQVGVYASRAHIRVTPQRHAADSAFVSLVQPGSSAAVTSFEVYPLRTGVHNLRIVSMPAGATERVVITVLPALEKPPTAPSRVWFGIQAGISRSMEHDAVGNEIARASDREGEIIGSLGRRWSIAVGMSAPRYTAGWFFAEPRWAPVSTRVFGHWLDVGAAFRVGTTDAQWQFDPGVLLRQQIAGPADGRGLSITFGYYLENMWYPTANGVTAPATHEPKLSLLAAWTFR